MVTGEKTKVYKQPSSYITHQLGKNYCLRMRDVIILVKIIAIEKKFRWKRKTSIITGN